MNHTTQQNQSPAELDRAAGMQAFMDLRAQAKANGVQDLSPDEINEEIRKARNHEQE